MSKVENINRYWVDDLSGTLIRSWTEVESNTLDHHTHIFEKHWRHISV